MLCTIPCDMTMQELMEVLCGTGSDDPKAVRIRNKASNLYLTVEMMSNGIVTQQTYLPLNAQLWIFEPIENLKDYFKIRNVFTGGIMTGDKSSNNSTQIKVSADSEVMTQDWKIEKMTNVANGFGIQNRMNKLFIDNPKGSTDIGVAVQAYSQKNNDNQTFYFEAIDCK